MIPFPDASLVKTVPCVGFVIPFYRVLIRNYFLVVVVFLVVLSSAFLVVEVAFEVICAVVLTVAAGALVVVAPATELEDEVLAPEALVASVVPEAAASVLEVTELELVLELALPEDAVFQ